MECLFRDWLERDNEQLKEMNQILGHFAMKEEHIADAMLRKSLPRESLRDFGPAIEDLYRRA